MQGRPKGFAATPRASKRVTRRMMERQRLRRRKFLVAILSLLLLILGGAAVIMIGPLVAGPAGPGGPGPNPPGVPMHIHANLSIWRDAQQATIPADIGRLPGNHYVDHGLDHWLDTREGQVGRLSPLHTHDSSGLIHIEASVTRGFTLGEFFSVWGQPLGPSQTVDLIPDAQHTLTMTVNGVPNNDWGNHIFANYENIEIHYDTI